MTTEDPRFASADQDLREASERLLFVFPELRERFLLTPASTMDRHSGVLWKRRDVFKNRWRPRWFALNPGQGILTYYLLNAPTTPSPMTPSSNSPFSGCSNGQSSTPTTPYSSQRNNNTNSNNNRTRSPSWDSQVSGVSENSLDYDVVPRGTIFLLGCTVAANESLSKPSENLYAFTIRPPQATESNIHLAARSIAARDQWMEKIAAVCHRNNTPMRSSSENTSLPSHLQTPRRDLYQREHSIPEHSVVEENGSSTIWETINTDVTKDLSPTLTEQIQHKMDTYLPMCDDFTSWNILNRSNNEIDMAAQTPDEHGRSIVTARKRFRQSALHIFSLLIDISRRHLYESNVQADGRIQVLNPHTFLDYYSYKAVRTCMRSCGVAQNECPSVQQVWPTSSREFAVCTHWRIVRRTNTTNRLPALLMVSFSCDESNAIRPVGESQVRGTAIISLVLLEPTESGGCIATRIVSVDLGGGMSLHLSNIIASQQASLPSVVEDYLERNEPDPPAVYKLPITKENVWKHVVAKVAHPTEHGKINNDEDPVGETFAVDANASSKIAVGASEPSLELQAMLLLSPVIVHKMIVQMNISGSSFAFLLLTYLAVRHLVSLRIGKHVGHSAVKVDSVTCRFWVDPKGLQRFVSNKREEREELNVGTTEILPLHVIMIAVARSLRKTSRVCRRRVRYPWLLIDRVVNTYKGFIDVTVVENDRSFTVPRVNTKSINDIADCLAAAKPSLDCGQCLVFPLENSEQSQVMVDVAATEKSKIVVLAVVGGLQNIDGNHNEIPFLRGRGSTKKVSLSLTIKGYGESLVRDAEELALECQKMVQFPEICEE